MFWRTNGNTNKIFMTLTPVILFAISHKLTQRRTYCFCFTNVIMFHHLISYIIRKWSSLFQINVQKFIVLIQMPTKVNAIISTCTYLRESWRKCNLSEDSTVNWNVISDVNISFVINFVMYLHNVFVFLTLFQLFLMSHWTSYVWKETLYQILKLESKNCYITKAYTAVCSIQFAQVA